MKDCRISSSIATGTRLLLVVSMCLFLAWRCSAAGPYAARVNVPLGPSAPLHLRFIPSPCPSPGGRGNLGADALDVEVLDAERVVLDEAAARLDLVAHQGREDLVCFVGVLDAHLQQRAGVGVHRRRP